MGGSCSESLASSLSTTLKFLSRLVATNTSAPRPPELISLVNEVSLGGGDNGGKFLLILTTNVLESEDSSSLLMNDGTETGLGLDDHVGNAHFTTQSGNEDNQFDGINIMSNNNKVGLFRLNEGDTVVQPIFDEERLLVFLLSLAFSSGLSLGFKSGLFLLLGLRTIFVQQLEQLRSRILIKGVGKLSNGGRDLETLVEDDLLPLKADVFGPLDKPGQVSGRLNVLSNAEVFGMGLEERVFGRFNFFLSEGGRGGLLA